MKKRLLLGLVLLAALWGGWTWYQNSRRAEASQVLYGNVDIREVNLGFRVSGKIVKVLKDEGDTVAANELLAQLDPEPYKHALAEAEGQVQSLKARLQMLTAGFRKEEIEQARAAQAEREATVANAERLFKRQQELLQSRTASQQEFDDARARLDEARARQASSQASLALLQAGYRREEIEQASGDLQRAEAQVATARVQVTDTELRAPAAGLIITRAQEPGAIVQPGASVLTISLENPVWVRAYVPEPQLARFKAGTKVSVFTDSRPDRPYEGTIGYVSPRAEFTPRSVETPELRTALVYRLRITVAGADGGLRQGMPVTIRLQ